jgi:hypothetical protein
MRPGFQGSGTPKQDPWKPEKLRTQTRGSQRKAEDRPGRLRIPEDLLPRLPEESRRLQSTAILQELGGSMGYCSAWTLLRTDHGAESAGDPPKIKED